MTAEKEAALRRMVTGAPAIVLGNLLIPHDQWSWWLSALLCTAFLLLFDWIYGKMLPKRRKNRTKLHLPEKEG